MNKVFKFSFVHSGLILALAASLVMLTGCDFFRSLVGKPTSAEIEQMRLAAEDNLKKQMTLDSARMAEAAAAAAADSMSVEEKVPPITADCPRYNVILGSFRVYSNADKMLKELDALGYTPKSIQFRNGFKLVSVFQGNGLSEAVGAMNNLRDKDFCPEDVWIYDLNQGLHE